MKYFYFLLFALILCACGSNKVVETRYKNGNPKLVHIYKTGDKKQSIHEINYFENGKVQMEGDLKNNEREGKWVSYYDNGTIWSEGTYVNGKREGSGNIYFPNGKIQIKGSYKNDEPVDIWDFFDESGKKIQTKNFDQGKAIPVN